MPNGASTVILLFVDPGEAALPHGFDVTANGAHAAGGFDPAAVAGASSVGIAGHFGVKVIDDVPDLRLIPVSGSAVLCAIEVRPALDSGSTAPDASVH